MCNRIIQKTDEYLSVVNWKNDGVADTLVEAVAIAKQGQDVGHAATLALRPTDRIFENWMNYNALVTYLYNRDTNVRTLLSALRKPIKSSTRTLFKYYLLIIYL